MNFKITITLSCLIFITHISIGKTRAAKDSTTKLFTHTIELGTIIRVGAENNYTTNDYDHQTVKTNNYLLGLHSQYLNVRASHLYKLPHGLGIGVAYGMNMFIHVKDVRVLLPLMAALRVDLLQKHKIHPFITERIGYAFLARNRSKEYMVTTKGIEGGATNEIVAGIDFGCKKKVKPELSIGYTFQHMHSTRLYDLANIQAYQAGYIPQMPLQVKETSDGFYQFIYLTLGLKF